MEYLNANQRFANLFGFDSPEEIIGLAHQAIMSIPAIANTH